MMMACGLWLITAGPRACIGVAAAPSRWRLPVNAPLVNAFWGRRRRRRIWRAMPVRFSAREETSGSGRGSVLLGSCHGLSSIREANGAHSMVCSSGLSSWEIYLPTYLKKPTLR